MSIAQIRWTRVLERDFAVGNHYPTVIDLQQDILGMVRAEPTGDYGVYHSGDARTWTRVVNVTFAGTIQGQAFSPAPGEWLQYLASGGGVSTKGGIVRSIDNGLTWTMAWTNTTASAGLNTVGMFRRIDGNAILAQGYFNTGPGFGDPVSYLISTDNGASWVVQSRYGITGSGSLIGIGGQRGFDYRSGVYLTGNIGYADGTGRALAWWRSQNRYSSVTEIRTATAGVYNDLNYIENIKFLTNDLVVASGQGNIVGEVDGNLRLQIWRSLDAGVTWTQITGIADYPAVPPGVAGDGYDSGDLLVIDDETLVLALDSEVINDQRYRVSNDAGLSWEALSVPVNFAWDDILVESQHMILAFGVIVAVNRFGQVFVGDITPSGLGPILPDLLPPKTAVAVKTKFTAALGL